jgi:hypothetical protein
MTATDTDPVLIQSALWSMISDIAVSDNVFVSNRPSNCTLTDFVVVDINGMVVDKAGHARCVCLVQLFAKDLDQLGTEDMGKLSTMYSTLLGALPYNTSPYTFTKKNQVGRRDSLGYHATLVNLDCLIY